MPKISVIVPVYNTEKYLEKCLNSIINQTFKDIEVIIINDGSTDNSEKIIIDFKNKYPDKIKYFKKENTGIADTRNFGIKQVCGNYFMFVDSDDYIDIELFENLLEYINNNIDLIKFKIIKVDEKYSELEKIEGPVFSSVSGEKGFNKLCFNDILIDTPCLYLFKTEFYKKNNFNFMKNTYHEDFGLIPLIILRAGTFVSTDIYGYKYVQVDNSIVRSKDYNKTVKKANDLFIHYDNMIETIKDYSITEQTKDNIKQYYTNAIFKARKQLIKQDKNKYIYEIKLRRLIKNIKAKGIKSILKKVWYVILFYDII